MDERSARRNHETGCQHGPSRPLRQSAWMRADTPPKRATANLITCDAFRRQRMTELQTAFGLIAGVVAAHEIGFWLGSLTRSADEPFDRQIALVRTSTAALVAFLIGFAFSGAASRFTNRVDIIVKEANALGTAYLRADTIAEPRRGELKAALKEYTADRATLLSR